MKILTEKKAPRRVTVDGASTNEQETSTMRGRCCQCGRLARLAEVADGFRGLGWCASCEQSNQQPEFEGVAV